MSAALNPYQLEATFFSSRPQLADLVSSTAADQTNARSDAPAVELCQIRKGTCFSGEIRGAGPLYIDGKVEGGINLPAGCVIYLVHASLDARRMTMSHILWAGAVRDRYRRCADQRGLA